MPSLERPQSFAAMATFVCPLAPPWVPTAGTLPGSALLPFFFFLPDCLTSPSFHALLAQLTPASLWVSLSVPGALILPPFLPCLPWLLLAPPL